jgi:hypothetical protein
MEVHEVHIKEWPKGQEALLSHKVPEPIPVSMQNGQVDPFHVNMNMNMLLQRPDTLPICIKICEPICAESNYKIGINLLGQPFAEIVVKGITRLFGCSKDKLPDYPVKDPEPPAKKDNPDPKPAPIVIK